MDVQEVRRHFPILSRSVAGSQALVYLDNAATSQRPKEVMDKYLSLSLEHNANIHRAVHTLSAEATEEYENSRIAVAEFINAGSPKEIVFTSGATASLNTVAQSFGDAFLSQGDNIIVSQEEHHSNIVPWQLLAQRKRIEIRVLLALGCSSGTDR